MNKNKQFLSKLGLIAVIGLIAAGCNNNATVETTDNMDQEEQEVKATPTPSVSPTPTGQASPTPTPTVSQGTTQTFTVKGSSFAFAPNQIKVKKGDKVKIVFENSNGTHDFVIDEFNAKTAILNSGQSETIEFTADKTGSFEFYCSVGTHRLMGMKGTLIVE